MSQDVKRYYIDSCRDERGFMRATDCVQSHEDTLRANSIEVMTKPTGVREIIEGIEMKKNPSA